MKTNLSHYRLRTFAVTDTKVLPDLSRINFNQAIRDMTPTTRSILKSISPQQSNLTPFSAKDPELLATCNFSRPTMPGCRLRGTRYELRYRT